ncbi:MAG: DnaA N-terminal domain-containing protein [Pseudomonadota bacterium]
MQSGIKIGAPKKRLTGPGVASFKYDIITALLVTASSAPGIEGRLAQRLALLITARVNWQTEQFAVGQRELAALWNVTERTVKRELGAMRSLRWISIASPSARGRVARHRVHFDQVLQSTAPHWDAVGPDFAARMSDTPEAETESNVVPLRPSPPLSGQDEWGWYLAAQTLRELNAPLFEAWFAGLVPVGAEGHTLTLAAPTRFIAEYVDTHYKLHLMRALGASTPEIKAIEITHSARAQ